MYRPTVAELAQRIQGEFREMPGLHLTEPQARRLWDLDEMTCREILNVLVDLRFLRRTRGGRYSRLDAA
jgi:hypothetical protein